MEGNSLEMRDERQKNNNVSFFKPAKDECTFLIVNKCLAEIETQKFMHAFNDLHVFHL